MVLNSPQNDAVRLPSLPEIDFQKFIGMEEPMVYRFLDVNLLEKDSLESKHARHHLGIGMPEVRAIQKRNRTSTMRDMIGWYQNSASAIGEQQTQLELQKSICSSQRTIKLVAIIVLAAAKLGIDLK